MPKDNLFFVIYALAQNKPTYLRQLFSADAAWNNATRTSLDEFHNIVSFGAFWQRCHHLVKSLRYVLATLIYDAVHVVYCVYGLVAEVATTQTYQIQSVIGKWLASCYHVWRDVLGYFRPALYHGMRANMGELVGKAATADNGKIVYIDLACQLCKVTYDDVVLQPAIVGNVAVCHEQAI